MKMTKLLSLTIAAILATGALSGCGEKKEGNVDGKTVITVDSWPDAESNPNEYERKEKQRIGFMEKHPDIILNGDHSKFDVQTFLARAEGGTLPTMYVTYLTEAKKIYELGYSGNVTEQFKNFGYYENINDYLLEKITFGGDVYYMPETAYTLGIVVNLDIYKEAGLVDDEGNLTVPQTFEELAELSKIVYEKTGKPGFVMPTTENVGGWNFMPIAWSYGVSFTENEDGKWKSTFNTEECVEALNLLKKMKWEDKSLPDSTLINANEAIKLVGTGQAAMTIAHPIQANSLTNYGLSKDSIGMMKMPAGPEKHVTLLGGSMFAFDDEATDEEKNACFEWLKYCGVTDVLDDDAKQTMEENYKTKAERGEIIGIKDLSIWSDASEREVFVTSLIDKYININPNHVKSYNDKEGIEYRVEEPVCTQDLYRLLDRCIQEVLTNKDADSAALIAEASKSFQENFLDFEE